MARPPLARLGFPASTASRSVWRTSTTLAAPTSKAPPLSSFSPPTISSTSSPSSSSLSRATQLSRHFTTSSLKMSYTVRKIAQPYTLEHRVYVEKDGQPVSPFHDIPLYANAEKTVLNMVVEIPRWTNAKQEVRSPSSSHPWVSISQIADPTTLRSPRRSSSTPSSRTPRRASCATSATASPTRATSGTTVPSPR